MIDKYDIKKLEWFLYLAMTYGTDAIKLIVGDEPSTWIVSVDENFILDRKRV